MTAREAIARFEPYIWNECYRKEFQEACSHAISALQEREERIKGCKYCTGVVLNVVEGATAFEVGFNFCPMCGRKLKGADNDKAD